MWKAGRRHRGENARDGTGGQGQEVRMERTRGADGADKILGEEKEQLTAENGKVTRDKYTRVKDGKRQVERDASWK
jgi:hypothetical protein